MCAIVGLDVTAIKRVRIGRLQLKGLGVGQWVCLKPKQAGALFQGDVPWKAWRRPSRADGDRGSARSVGAAREQQRTGP